jgi:hypothetical protein
MDSETKKEVLYKFQELKHEIFSPRLIRFVSNLGNGYTATVLYKELEVLLLGYRCASKILPWVSEEEYPVSYKVLKYLDGDDPKYMDQFVEAYEVTRLLERLIDQPPKVIVDSPKTRAMWKPVYQWRRNGEFVKEHLSAQHAELATGIYSNNITAATNRKLKSAGGFYWSKNRDFKINE